MKILVVHKNCPWLMGNSTHRAAQIIQGALAADTEVCVLWRKRTYGEDVSRAARREFGHIGPALESTLSGFERDANGTITQVFPAASPANAVAATARVDVVVSFSPIIEMWDVVDEALRRGAKHIFDVSDNWATMSARWGTMRADQNENEWIRRSHAVSATTESLLDGLPKDTPRRVIKDLLSIPMARALARRVAAVSALERRESVVYSGGLDPRRFDWTLLERLAQELRGYRIDVVGRMPSNVADYSHLITASSNVVFHGERHLEYVADLYLRARVGIVPFAVNDATRKLLPIKVLEYAAAGLSVLSTKLPEVYRSGLAETPDLDNFSAAIERQLSAESRTPVQCLEGPLLGEWACKFRQMMSLVQGEFAQGSC